MANKKRDDWIAKDATFKQQQSTAEAAYKRFLAGQQLNLNQRNITHKRDIEANTRGRTEALNQTNNSFAARGLGSSGLFVKARNKSNENFNRQRTALEQALKNFQADQNYEKSNATAQKNETITRARMDAADRYAQQQYLKY